MALLSDLIKSITGGRNVTHDVVSESVLNECQSEVEHIAIDLDDIYLRIIIANPISSFYRTVILREHKYEVLITITRAGKVIQTLIIVDPECNVPGFIILPTIILSGENITLERGSHLVQSVRGFVLVKLERINPIRSTNGHCGTIQPNT